jgi:hypothetical protein
MGGGGVGMPLQVFFCREGLGSLACCCPELINSEMLILWTVGRTPWTGDQICRKVTYRHRATQTDTHSSSGIRTHYLSA